MEQKIINLLLFFLLLAGTSANSQELDFNVRFNGDVNAYEVYARPAFTDPFYFIGGGSQLSILLPESAADNALSVTSVNGGLWTDNSQVYAPAADPDHDFHGVATNGATISLISGVEVLLFRFTITEGCIPEVRLFENGPSPAPDPGSSAPGMNGGDFRMFFANVFDPLNNNWRLNYANEGLVCPEAPVVIPNPITVPQGETASLCLPILDLNVTDTFTVALCTGSPVNGTSTPTITGNTLCLDYTPTATYSGLDEICLIVCDVSALCDTVSIPVTVVPLLEPIVAQEPPIVIVTPMTTPQDSTVTVCTEILDHNVGDTFTSTFCGGQDNGTASATIVNNVLCLEYIPNLGYSGTDAICIDVCDQDGNCDAVNIPVSIIPTPAGLDSLQAPIVVMPPIVTPEDSTITVCGPIIEANVGDTHTVSICGAAVNGAAIATVDDTDNKLCIEYDPNPNFYGTDSICVTVCDQTSLCYSLTVPIEVTPYNDQPFAINDINSTQMDIPTSGNVLTNDNDVEGDVMTVNTTPLNVTNGTVIIDPLGNYTFTPTTGFVGNGFFQYTVCDDGHPSRCSVTDVVIAVMDNANTANVSNNQVIGTPDDFVIQTNNTLSASVISNDSDPDGDNLVITTTPVSGPLNGSVTIFTDGMIDYTPIANYVGPDQFIYQICDDGAPQSCADVVVFIDVLSFSPLNSIHATFDANSGGIDQTQSGNVTDNDIDPEAGILTVVLDNDVSTGTLILDPDGSYTFDPDPGFVGIESFVYTVCDNGFPIACDNATVYLQVVDLANIRNNDVVGAPDNFVMEVGDTLSASVISNDTDPDGDNLSITTTPVSIPSNGAVTINPDGTIEYIPDPGYSGVDNFLYEVCDDGFSQSCTNVLVTIDILENDGINNLYATDDENSGEVGQLQSGDVTANDYDPESGTLTVNTSPISDVSNGTLTLNANGTYTYLPNTGYVGNDQFVYSVCDDDSPIACDEATVYLTVLDSKDAPVVITNPITISVDSTGSLCMPITDPNPGDTFTVIGCTGSPSNGIASSSIVDGSLCVDYTPTSGYTGTDDICLIVCDQTSRCDTVSVPVTVVPSAIPTPVEEAPAVIITPITVAQDSTVELCTPIMDRNVGDIFTATFCASTPINGSATATVIGNNLCLEYTPNAGYTGSDDLCINVCDQTGRCDNINVPVSVIGTPEIQDTLQAPILVMPPVVTFEDVNETACGTIIDVNISDTHTVTICDQPVNGAATAVVDNALNSLCITFDPDPNFIGSDSVCVTVCDQGPLCYTLIVPIEVIPLNDPPLAINDINNTQVNIPTWGNVLTNDSDPDGNNISVNTTPISVSDGTVTIDTSGQYTFVPDPGFIGDASFEYEVCDDGDPVGCDTLRALIAVVDVSNDDNNEVTGIPDNFYTEDDAPLTADLLSNDSDPDDDAITINTTPVSVPTNGTLVINADGTFLYTPLAGFYGVETFSYQVCDDGTPLDCDIVPVTITILEGNGLNDVYATDDSNIGEEDETLTGDVTLNDNDPENGVLTVATTPLVAPINGTLTLNTNGTYSYQPDADFTGNDQFVYMVCDDGATSACDSATVYITVLNVSTDLRLKVMLQGALFGATDSLMRADLVDQDLVPLNQPYDTSAQALFIPRFNPTIGGYEVTTDSILNTNAGTPDAIVDWVFVEFRDATDSVTVLRTLSALVQRDGDVVNPEDGGTIYVDSLPSTFFVVIKHRNHLGAMTGTPVASISKIAEFDFTTATGADLYHNAGYDSLEQVSIYGHEALWAGNSNADSKTKYDGPVNDRFIINANILLDPLNTSNTLNFDNAIEYYLGDVNLDGKAKYDGIGNDRILIQSNVLTYPLNASLLNNYNLFFEQVR